MAGHAQRLKLRLFIEGVEVPVIAANVQTAPNSPAVATIQIPPLPEATEFKPRSIVHLFFLDFYEVDSPLLRDTVAAASSIASGQANPTTFERSSLRAVQGDGSFDQAFISSVAVNDMHNEKYKLLFAGELVGFQYTKSERSRSMVLQCSDFSNYWDYAYQFSNTDLFGPGMKALFAGGATNLFTDFLEDEGSVIARILKTPSVQYPGLKGLLGGIVHLLEAIGGSYYYDKKFAGQNIFFSLAELRLHITQMITAYENDPTAARLLNAHGFDGMFSRTLGGLGSQVSFRQAINALMGHIFHETYAIPTPLYVPGTGGTVTGFVRKKIREDASSAFVANVADGVITTLQGVKMDLAPASLEPVKAVIQRLSSALNLLRATAQKIRAKNIQAALSCYGSAQTSIGVVISRLKAARSSPSVLTAVQARLDDAIEQLKKAGDLEINTTAQKKAIPARLNQHIFRPDVWFTAPPMCNVLFPDTYKIMSYARSLLQEPTRLMLKTNDEFFGEDELFDNFYFAPKAFGLKTSKNTLSAILTNDILDHEIFTGILPVFEKMGELNIFSIRSGTIDGKMPKVGLAQRSANFLYFKYRFAARQMQISARFSPYLAPGFPGLVIDSYADTATLQRYNELARSVGRPTRSMNKLLGVHFLGNFTEISHSIDQQDGKTDINCGYARQPDESVEFLGVIADGQTVQKRADKDAVRSTDVAALNPPRLFSIGPNQGQITDVIDVTDKYRPSLAADGSVDMMIDLPLFTQGRQSSARIPIGVSQPPSAYGPEVEALAGSDVRPLVFRAYRIREEVPRYRQEVVDLPAEEYIRPGWYGDVWHPSKIGEAYQQFFRTGAITDPITLADASGASLNIPNQAASDALSEASAASDSSDPRATAPAVLALETNSSIEQAVAFLALTYSYIRSGGLDPEEFFRAYSWRPIATMVDIFGTSDLQLSTDGTQVVQGIEGFHSRAFGPFDNLFGLVTSDIENIVGIKRGSPQASKGDKRKVKQDAVKAYVATLLFSRAILG